MGKKVLLPKVDVTKSRLVLCEINDIGELSPGYMGILEPNLGPERSRTVDDADIVILPGVVFDFSGNRLGYGRGYYDKLLSGRKKIAPILALAYAEQLVERIPVEEHDVRVNIIVTDIGVIRVP